MWILIRKHEFDGLDMNWQFPGWGDGYLLRDGENFSILLKVFFNWIEKKDFFQFFLSLGNANSIWQKRISFNSYDLWNTSDHKSVLNNNYKIIYDF